MRNFTVTLGRAAWRLFLALPAALVVIVAVILALPAILVGALLGERVR